MVPRVFAIRLGLNKATENALKYALRKYCSDQSSICFFNH